MIEVMVLLYKTQPKLVISMSGIDICVLWKLWKAMKKIYCNSVGRLWLQTDEIMQWWYHVHVNIQIKYISQLNQPILNIMYQYLPAYLSPVHTRMM